MAIKPFEGRVVLKFLEDAPEVSPNPDGEEEAVLAIVTGAGAKTPVKAGDTVLVDAYARRGGTKIDEHTRVVHAHYLVAKVTDK